MGKLTALHINIIGAVVALILSVALFFLLIKPKNEQLQLTQAETEQTKSSGGTEAAWKKAQRDLKDTQIAAQKTEAAWSVNERRYMPTLAFGQTKQPLNLFQNDAYVDPQGERFGLRDIPRLWGVWLEGWYGAQQPGTKFILADDKPYIGIPSYSPDPNAIAQLKALTFPETGKAWKIAVVSTTFNNAMAHLRKVNTMQQHGMPVVNNVVLAGHSPNLAMAYEMAIYVIPHSDPPAADPIIAPAGADANKSPGAAGFSLPGGGGPGGPGGPRGGPPRGGTPGGGG